MRPLACVDVFVALKVLMLQCGGNSTLGNPAAQAASGEYSAVLHNQALKDKTCATTVDLFNRLGYQMQLTEVKTAFAGFTWVLLNLYCPTSTTDIRIL